MRSNRALRRRYSRADRAVRAFRLTAWSLFLVLVPGGLAGCYEAARPSAGVTADCETEPDPPRVGPVILSCRFEKAGVPDVRPRDVRIEANMTHPGMQPVTGTLSEAEDGRYVGGLTLTMGGDWYVVVAGLTDEGQHFESTVPLPGVRARNTVGE